MRPSRMNEASGPSMRRQRREWRRTPRFQRERRGFGWSIPTATRYSSGKPRKQSALDPPVRIDAPSHRAGLDIAVSWPTPKGATAARVAIARDAVFREAMREEDQRVEMHKLLHARQFSSRRPPRRNLAHTAIAQALPTVLLVALNQPLEMPTRHASGSPASSPVSRPLQQRPSAFSNFSANTSHSTLVRRIAPSRTGGEHGGQLTRYERRTTDASLAR